jgi:hypothetical protein
MVQYVDLVSRILPNLHSDCELRIGFFGVSRLFVRAGGWVKPISSSLERNGWRLGDWRVDILMGNGRL